MVPLQHIFIGPFQNTQPLVIALILLVAYRPPWIFSVELAIKFDLFVDPSFLLAGRPVDSDYFIVGVVIGALEFRQAVFNDACLAEVER